MAAYAALLSVMHILERIKQAPTPPNSLDKTQLQSLSQNVSFFLDFLERYSHDGSEEADELESRIRDAAHAAEDLIESHIVDQIAAGISTTSTHPQKMISSIDHLYQDLEKVIQDLAFIREDVMAVKEKRGIINLQINTNSSVLPAHSLTRSASMVGFDDLLYEAMYKLIGGQLQRQLIPISGMGGMGKTMLATNLFIHKTVVQHFDVLAWVTISQQYSLPDILLAIMQSENRAHGGEYEVLGELVHKHLYGRRYFIVMDDMWVIDVWNKIKRFFPDNNNGSRILITTRLSNVAIQLSETHGLKMKYLNEVESWDLLCKNIFGEECCPPELEEIGRKIANSCKGLPLSIIVIARVLAKSIQTQEYWKYIEENLSSIVNLENNAHCLKILSTSYNILPVHLKPCFLYMGIFKEDTSIFIPSLISLWVAEGFLKSISGKSLEEIAKENIKELVDRNLVFLHNVGWKEDSCGIHDLLRDVCLKQSEREKFYFVTIQREAKFLQGTSNERRIVVRGETSLKTIQSLQAMPLVRSLICDFDMLLDLRLLRILSSSQGIDVDSRKVKFNGSLETVFSQLVNSRYLDLEMNESRISGTRIIPSSLYLLWNVHTLKVEHPGELVAPCDIWNMPQLRHIEFSSLQLPHPPHMDGQDDVVLENLHTLLIIKNFRCSEEVVKRIPNIKELRLRYDDTEEWSNCCFDNLHLLEIESLYCTFFSVEKTRWSDLLQKHNFPNSLKSLTLDGSELDWEEITRMTSYLPHLQELFLNDCTRGVKWETIEGGFLKLKLLVIGYTDLECWISESDHFPVLEQIFLVGLRKLEKIPCDLGNIPTFKLIHIVGCSHSAILFAKEMIEEQEELGNEDIRVSVLTDNEEVKCLQSRNFKIRVSR